MAIHLFHIKISPGGSTHNLKPILQALAFWVQPGLFCSIKGSAFWDKRGGGGGSSDDVWSHPGRLERENSIFGLSLGEIPGDWVRSRDSDEGCSLHLSPLHSQSYSSYGGECSYSCSTDPASQPICTAYRTISAANGSRARWSASHLCKCVLVCDCMCLYMCLYNEKHRQFKTLR